MAYIDSSNLDLVQILVRIIKDVDGKDKLETTGWEAGKYFVCNPDIAPFWRLQSRFRKFYPHKAKMIGMDYDRNLVVFQCQDWGDA